MLWDVQYLCVRFGLFVRSNGRDGVQTDTEVAGSVKHWKPRRDETVEGHLTAL
jgi:hypothetical protein